MYSRKGKVRMDLQEVIPNKKEFQYLFSKTDNKTVTVESYRRAVLPYYCTKKSPKNLHNYLEKLKNENEIDESSELSK